MLGVVSTLAATEALHSSLEQTNRHAGSSECRATQPLLLSCNAPYRK